MSMWEGRGVPEMDGYSKLAQHLLNEITVLKEYGVWKTVAARKEDKIAPKDLGKIGDRREALVMPFFNIAFPEEVGRRLGVVMRDYLQGSAPEVAKPIEGETPKQWMDRVAQLSEDSVYYQFLHGTPKNPFDERRAREYQEQRGIPPVGKEDEA